MLRHRLFLTAAFDLGIFSQSLWTTIHSNAVLFNTPEFIELGVWSHLGVHFQPVLFLLAPLYYLYPSPKLLLSLVPLAMFIAGLIFYGLSRSILGDPGYSAYSVLFFVLCPFAWFSDDFHPSVLAVPVILAIVYLSHNLLVKKDYSLKNKFGTVLLSVLLLLTKEDSGIALISIGILFILVTEENRGLLDIVRDVMSFNGFRRFYRAHKVEFMFIILGILSVLIETFVLVPIFNPSGIYPFLSGDIKDVYIDQTMSYYKIVYIVIWLGYFGIPLLRGPRFLIPTLPPLMEIILMGSWPPVITVGSHYAYMLLPISLVSVLYALQFAKRHKAVEILGIMKSSIAVAILVFILVSPPVNLSEYFLVWGAPSYKLSSGWDMWGGYMVILDESLPIFYGADERCALVVQGNMFPRLSNRNTTYVIRTVFGDSYLQNNSIVIVDSVYEGLFNSSMRAIKGRLQKDEYSNVQVIDVRDVVSECSGLDPAETPIRPEESVIRCVTETFKRYIEHCESQLIETP
ncbi:DUF2079 domain-containing protein [Thermococcus sp. MV11]|uniref:DUF2079 domain-containing protein n=1 Tax=Thermococcus sp. MV11 TaxID=1638267 RepID=UPI001F1026F9|nr:DUF2079 domain-containing protein [Thermococcus sp. MV11]